MIHRVTASIVRIRKPNPNGETLHGVLGVGVYGRVFVEMSMACRIPSCDTEEEREQKRAGTRRTQQRQRNTGRFGQSRSAASDESADRLLARVVPALRVAVHGRVRALVVLHARQALRVRRRGRELVPALGLAVVAPAVRAEALVPAEAVPAEAHARVLRLRRRGLRLRLLGGRRGVVRVVRRGLRRVRVGVVRGVERREERRVRGGAAALELGVGDGERALHQRVALRLVLLLLVRTRRCGRARELAEAGQRVGRRRLGLCGILEVGLSARDEVLETVLPVTVWADEGIIFCKSKG
jgi:hypothetical protein